MAASQATANNHIIPWAAVTFLRDAEGDKIELGRGSFGAVYACEYSFMKVAVKVLEVNGRPLLVQQVAALRGEAELQARLSHEHIVRVFGLAIDDRDPTKVKCGLVMSLMHTDLSHILLEASMAPAEVLGLWLPFSWRLRSLVDLASGLARLHVNRVVHSDLKPGNIMLSAPSRGAVVGITDFGFARVTQRVEAASDGAAAGLGMSSSSLSRRGTLRYVAPELCKVPAPGERSARPSYASDVYSWAVVAYLLLAARPDPFPGLTDAQVMAAHASGRPCVIDLDMLPQECPLPLKELLRSCLSSDPSHRPRSGAELLELLRATLPADVLHSQAGVPPILLPPSERPAAGSPVSPILLPPSERPAAGSPVPPILLPPSERPAAGSPAAQPAAADPSSATDTVPDIVPWRASIVLAECPICSCESVPGVKMGCGRTPEGSQEHAVCLPCALRTIRLELSPGARAVRCPVCLSDRLAGSISEAAVAEVAAWSRMAGRSDATGDLRPLSNDELARHAAMVAEAARVAAESALPEGLFKRCPNCSTPISRPRGHACHHITPGTGCPGCQEHFCFACLRLYQPGESHVRCPNGCPIYCSPACNCFDCPDCAPGQPCGDCDGDGRCWVSGLRTDPALAQLPLLLQHLLQHSGPLQYLRLHLQQVRSRLRVQHMPTGWSAGLTTKESCKRFGAGVMCAAPP